MAGTAKRSTAEKWRDARRRAVTHDRETKHRARDEGGVRPVDGPRHDGEQPKIEAADSLGDMLGREGAELEGDRAHETARGREGILEAAALREQQFWMRREGGHVCHDRLQ